MEMKWGTPICLIIIFAVISTSYRHGFENILDGSMIYRLPGTVIPTFYDLSLTIDPAKSDFTGNLNITFNVADENSTVKDIYTHIDKDYVAIQSIMLNNEINCTAGVPNEAGIAIVKCSEGVTGSSNSLYIRYKANFSEDGYGMFKSTYKDQGEEQTIIESVFEPTYARRAFPCFDEPDLRANFSIEIKYPKEYNAISNSLVKETIESRSDMLTARFAVTPRISTYLVSIIISKLHLSDIKSNDGYDFKVFTRADMVGFTSKVIGKYYSQILEKLGEYTNQSFQSNTECYQVILPEYSDTSGGFGIFAYRETDLLDDGNKTTHRATQDIITNMAYKLIHNWYGGDLNVKWWSDIWANEAIATYVAYIIADEINDEFELKNQFTMEVVRKALHNDAYPFTLPLSSNESVVESTNNITNKLDIFSYQKGASILRMISYYIGGEDPMKSSLAYHWTQRNETNTNGSDLLKDLTENHSDENDLYSYLLPWIYSPGYPLLTAKIVNLTGTGVEVIKLYQKRFVYPVDDVKENDDVKWVIPFNTASAGNELFYTRVDGYYTPDDEFYFFHMNNDFMMFNVQSGFFYRVNYDEILWKRIIKSLNDETEMNKFDTLSRAQLVDDIFNIARIGDVSYSLAFQLADFLAHETEYYPWYAAFDAFSYILGKTGERKAETNLSDYILKLMTNVLNDSHKKASAKNETHLDVLKRVMVLKWACDLVHTESANSIIKTFEEYKKDQSSLVDYDLRSVIFCNGIRYSENATKDWQFLWNIYATSLSVHEQEDILKALGCAEEKELLDQYLLKIITPDSGIKKQDALIVFKSIFSSSAGISAATGFLDNNITEIVSLGHNIWPEMLYTIAEKLLSDQQLEWFTNKLDNNIFDDYEDVKSKAKTLISVNNYWENNYQVHVKEVLLTITTTTAPATTTETPSPTTTTIATTEASSITPTPVISTTTEGSANSVQIFSNIISISLTVSLFYQFYF